MADCEPQIAILLRLWRMNRGFYWRWENYDGELVERGLATLFRGAKWRERVRALGDMTGLKAGSDAHAILQEAGQAIAELLGASEGIGKMTVRTRA